MLDRERILKALVFDKTNQKTSKMEELEAKAHKIVVTMSKCVSIFLAGAWCYKDLREMCILMYHRALQRAQEFSLNMENLTENVVAEMSELGLTVSHLALGHHFPNFDTVIKLQCSSRDYTVMRVVASEFCRHNADTMSRPDLEFLSVDRVDTGMIMRYLPS